MKPICKTVLIIEDDESIRETVKLILEVEGYAVRLAGHGREGLDELHKMRDSPCLILLDLMMPIMDGWAFVATMDVEKELASIPVVLMTAFTDKAKTISKAQGVLEKPVKIDELMKWVKEYCG